MVMDGKQDKATMEFESFYSGTLLHVGLAEGDSAKVESILAIIGPKGTDVNPYLSGSKKTAEKPKTQEERKAYNYFDRFIFNMERLLHRVGLKSKFANYAAVYEQANSELTYSLESVTLRLL